jgi:magnesium transporter
MITIHKHKKLTWVDLESPTADEVKSLMREYSIHPMVAEELLKPTLRAKVDIYKNFIYLIMHFPIFEPSKKTSMSCEIDFIIGENFLITAHYRTITPLHEIIKMFEVGSLIDRENLAKNPGIIVFYIVKHLYEFALRQLDHIQLKIDEIEENIFKHQEKEMVEIISVIHRDVLDFHRAIYAHESILSSFGAVGQKFFGSNFIHYTNVIFGELARVKSLLENCKATIESLQETNDSLLTDRVNDIMRTLTTVSFITFPLMLFAALFGMSNNVSMPIVGKRGDFWIILSIMLISASLLLLIFKRKKWL